MDGGRYAVTVILGAPGAGKGTQARSLSQALGIPHVASGDLLREHRRRGTPLGLTARAYMDRGDLVPDELVVQMMVERLSRQDAMRGALLDGFPRTLAQATTLDAELAERGGGVRAALLLDVPAEVLVERLSGRRICIGCQDTFHVQLQSLPEDGTCPRCGDRLVQRPDDTPKVVLHRVEVYAEQTAPVIDYYRGLGVLRCADGTRSVEEIRDALLTLAKSRPSLLAAS
ncbi:MAG: adenylate kinase [Chloroflexota bacterium]